MRAQKKKKSPKNGTVKQDPGCNILEHVSSASMFATNSPTMDSTVTPALTPSIVENVNAYFSNSEHFLHQFTKWMTDKDNNTPDTFESVISLAQDQLSIMSVCTPGRTFTNQIETLKPFHTIMNAQNQQTHKDLKQQKNELKKNVEDANPPTKASSPALIKISATSTQDSTPLSPIPGQPTQTTNNYHQVKLTPTKKPELESTLTTTECIESNQYTNETITQEESERIRAKALEVLQRASSPKNSPSHSFDLSMLPSLHENQLEDEAKDLDDTHSLSYSGTVSALHDDLDPKIINMIKDTVENSVNRVIRQQVKNQLSNQVVKELHNIMINPLKHIESRIREAMQMNLKKEMAILVQEQFSQVTQNSIEAMVDKRLNETAERQVDQHLQITAIPKLKKEHQNHLSKFERIRADTTLQLSASEMVAMESLQSTKNRLQQELEASSVQAKEDILGVLDNTIAVINGATNQSIKTISEEASKALCEESQTNMVQFQRVLDKQLSLRHDLIEIMEDNMFKDGMTDNNSIKHNNSPQQDSSESTFENTTVQSLVVNDAEMDNNDDKRNYFDENDKDRNISFQMIAASNDIHENRNTSANNANANANANANEFVPTNIVVVHGDDDNNDGDSLNRKNATEYIYRDGVEMENDEDFESRNFTRPYFPTNMAVLIDDDDVDVCDDDDPLEINDDYVQENIAALSDDEEEILFKLRSNQKTQTNTLVPYNDEECQSTSEEEKELNENDTHHASTDAHVHILSRKDIPQFKPTHVLDSDDSDNDIQHQNNANRHVFANARPKHDWNKEVQQHAQNLPIPTKDIAIQNEDIHISDFNDTNHYIIENSAFMDGSG